MKLYRIDKIVQCIKGQPFWMPWGFWKWLFYAFLFLVLLLLYLLLFTIPFEKKERILPDVHEGDVEVLLTWSTADDLDLHCQGPDGEVISYENFESSSGGKLDVDMNIGGGTDGNTYIEHIYWPVGRAPEGQYRVWVKLFRRYTSYRKSEYTVTVKVNGNEQTYSGSLERAGSTDEVCMFISVQ